MATLDEFLKKFPDLQSNPAPHDSVRLNVEVLGVDDNKIDFSHLGQTFSVSRDDVIDISEHSPGAMPPRGKAVVLTIKSAARLDWKHSIRASELNSSIPFQFAQPSAAPLAVPQHPAIATWMSRVGYVPNPHYDRVIGGGSTCESYSDGRSDDSKFDDW